MGAKTDGELPARMDAVLSELKQELSQYTVSLQQATSLLVLRTFLPVIFADENLYKFLIHSLQFLISQFKLRALMILWKENIVFTVAP